MNTHTAHSTLCAVLDARLALIHFLALCLALGATPAKAEVASGHFVISPMVGYRDGGRFDDPVTGERRNVDGDTALAIAAAYQFSPALYYELFYSRQSTDLGRDSLELDIEYLHFGGRLDFAREARVIPFLAGGLGATRINARGRGLGSDLRPGLSLAGGLEFPIAASAAIRLEARGYMTLTGGEREIFCQSGNGAICALAYEGDVLWQLDLLAGLTVRF